MGVLDAEVRAARRGEDAQQQHRRVVGELRVPSAPRLQQRGQHAEAQVGAEAEHHRVVRLGGRRGEERVQRGHLAAHQPVDSLHRPAAVMHAPRQPGGPGGCHVRRAGLRPLAPLEGLGLGLDVASLRGLRGGRGAVLLQEPVQELGGRRVGRQAEHAAMAVEQRAHHRVDG
eukprot:scaffold37831_cov51-Phaeocystis_antarctica.AAC.1